MTSRSAIFFLRRVPPGGNRGLQSQSRLSGDCDVQCRIGADRDAPHATVDAPFVDEGLRARRGDTECEAPQFIVAEELLTELWRTELVDTRFGLMLAM